jgi:lysophospholipid hydrolase
VASADRCLVVQVADHIYNLKQLPADSPDLATPISGGNPALEDYCPLRVTVNSAEHKLLWLPAAKHKHLYSATGWRQEKRRASLRAKQSPLCEPNAGPSLSTSAGAGAGAAAGAAATVGCRSSRYTGRQVPIELILLHPPATVLPLFTRAYLNAGSRRFDLVHHIRMDPGAEPLQYPAPAQAPAVDTPYETLPLFALHLRRICRHISGVACGLVMSGGGARGMAHLGALRALAEFGLPVDYVGGTSQGACIGAMFAATWGWGMGRVPRRKQGEVDEDSVFDGSGSSEMELRARNMATVFGSLWGLVSDATLPLVAFFSAKRFNDNIIKVLGDAAARGPLAASSSPSEQLTAARAELLHVEDLWVPFFCNSTNVSRAEMRVHNHGLLWYAVRASMSVLPYIPPCHERSAGDLLIDGGYCNNLVVTPMYELLKPRYVFAVDVENKNEEHLQNIYDFGYFLDGFKLFLARLLRGFSTPAQHVPAYSEIIGTLIYLNHNRTVRAAADSIDMYVRPRVQQFKLLEYELYNDIVAAGYKKTVLLCKEFMKQFRG